MPDTPTAPLYHHIEIQIDEAFAGLVAPATLTDVATATLRRHRVVAAELTVVVTGDDEVRRLNRDYRGIDATTDVLSFAAQEDAAPDAPALVMPPELAAELSAYLGDIVIAYPYAAQQAAHFGVAVASELRLLVVHGVLHLLGYDHDTAEAEAEMWAAQEAALAEFGEQGLSQRQYDV
jgi:probable rRNA maturation factor